MESPLDCVMGASVEGNIGVVAGVVCEELDEGVVEDAKEELGEVIVVEVGPIVSGILIAAGVSQQAVFDPQHQAVAVEASPPQGATGALPLVS
ncbi:hypothetical protein V497_07745 [Pseudogymnoascus sp. VKM F-4516 (FW-969)]|nr:hypothetical protein V497_07745 [Pseudogymnoascus sp. VKM F-4516 (FW-969)]